MGAGQSQSTGWVDDTLFQVLKVVDGSPAVGSLIRSDIVHEIDGSSVLALSLDEMIGLLVASELTVSITVERLPEDIRHLFNPGEPEFDATIGQLQATSEEPLIAETAFDTGIAETRFDAPAETKDDPSN